MELIKFLLYIIAFTQLSYSGFFDFCLFNLFLEYAYYHEPFAANKHSSLVHKDCFSNDFDITDFFIKFVHITLHIMSALGHLCICHYKSHPIGKPLIESYKFLDNGYQKLRKNFLTNLIQKPLKLLRDKFILPQTIKIFEMDYFKQHVTECLGTSDLSLDKLGKLGKLDELIHDPNCSGQLHNLEDINQFLQSLAETKNNEHNTATEENYNFAPNRGGRGGGRGAGRGGGRGGFGDFGGFGGGRGGRDGGRGGNGGRNGGRARDLVQESFPDLNSTNDIPTTVNTQDITFDTGIVTDNDYDSELELD